MLARSTLRIASALKANQAIFPSMQYAFLSTKSQGKVKWFDTKKGFGFITPTTGGEDIFVHQSQIKTDGFRSLTDGEDVEFNLSIDTNRGGKRYATEVTGPDGSPVKGVNRSNFSRKNDRY